MYPFKLRLNALFFASFLLISLPLAAIARPAAGPGVGSSSTLPIAGNGPAPAAHAVVRGTVADPSGAIVPNAEVDLVDGKGAVAATLHSDGEGNFQLTAPGLGDYTLIVSEAGFDTVKTVVKLGTPGAAALTGPMLHIVLPISTM